MPENLLPKLIEPLKLAEQGKRFVGVVALDEMSRLKALNVVAKSPVGITIQCGIDSEGFRYLKGEVEACVQLECQRCMRSYTETINTDFSLVPIAYEEEATLLPGHYEGLLVENHSIELKTLVEDELLLALPIVPRHRDHECRAEFTSVPFTEVLREKAKPFAVLAELKRNSRS